MSTEYQTNNLSSMISKLTDLSLDIMHEIFDYLTLGDIYYSFYQFFKTFIDNCYSCLNFMSMSYSHFLFYHENILFNNSEHCEKISSLILLNEKPFNQLNKFIPIIYLYKNLKRLHLYSLNENQLEILPLILPNLSELYIDFKNEKIISNIKWISYLKKLQIFSIDLKTSGIQIDYSLRSLSPLLSSITITLSSTYDFYRFLSLLPVDTLRHLNISLFDSEFSYIKTFRSPISLASKLISFTFNISLIPMKNTSCLYDILRFVSTTLRCLKILTILCRFTNGIIIDEEKLRHYLSHIYSVKNFRLFIEMNNDPIAIFNQFIFDETVYNYPFWINKNVHVNIYRNKDNDIKRIRIYTLPLVSKIINIPNDIDDMYKLNISSSNIHQFISNDINDKVYHFIDDKTLTPNRIYSSSNLSLLSYLPRLSSFKVIENEMFAFLKLSYSNQSFHNIRKLELDHWSNFLMKNTQLIFQIFPYLQSLSIYNIDEFDIFGNILNKFLNRLPNQQLLIHLRIGGLIFHDICLEHFDEEQLKRNFNEIFISLYNRINAYDISFDRSNQFIDIWC